MNEIKGFSLYLFLAFLRCAVAKESEVRALVGAKVLLPCRVDVKQCGTLHSVKWYKEASRIYVFSQVGQIRRGEGDDSKRMNVTYNEEDNETLLQIDPVKVDDEATYKCEITYLEVGENCDVVQTVKLTTLVKPSEVVLTYNEEEIMESTTLEEKNEGDEVVLTCKAPGGKPIPTVSWYNGTQLMNRASYSARSDNDGTGTGISTLRLTLTRGDVNAHFECKVESQALDEPIKRRVVVPVKVNPTKIELSGVKGHVTEGTIVSLLCQAFNARPKAEVEWYNNTDVPMKPDQKRGIDIRTQIVENADGTYTTKSTLSFSATRFENGIRFDCYAKNEVTVAKGEPRLHALMYLFVRYPPVITISAIGNTVVNEGDEVTLSCKYFSNPQKLEAATWVKDGQNVTKLPGKHKNGDTNIPSLTISRITRDDMGEYRCLLKNEVNLSISEDLIFLDVRYPPNVELIMLPSNPANATEQTNVTLFCNVTSGNPPALRKVRWYLDGEVMAELPDCNYTLAVVNDTLDGNLCGINPSILSLVKVEQSFAGNYTCQGENDAGIGPVSEPKELIVYYPPSAVKLTHHPPTVIKKAQVTLSCTVEEAGFPTKVTYLWFRNGHMVHNITSSSWTIPQASLETRSNFSCIALNKGGQSRPAFDFVNVEAPPALIPQDNKLYKGILYSSPNMSLSCRIECSPLCFIKWYKDNKEIDFETNPLYYVINRTHAADYKKNDFESVESILVWNMTNWPGYQLNKRANNSFYTCASYDLPDRHRIQSNFTTEIAIDYPPENITLSQNVINVVEDEMPAFVKCSGDGRPTLSYVWKKNVTGEIVIKSDTLKLPKMKRTEGGYYTCEASNRYGSKIASVRFNVYYKPECTIEKGDVDGNPSLICKADGNPKEMSFSWIMIERNKTVDLVAMGDKVDFSYILLDSNRNSETEYQCIANNTIKISDPCSIKIPAYQEQSSIVGRAGSKLPWYLNRENLTVIIASIVTLIICFLIVCIIIIILCRKKRQNTKSSNNPLEMEEREKSVYHQLPENSIQSKWPLKPGVLIHVNKMHHVNIRQLDNKYSFRAKSLKIMPDRNKAKVYARFRRLKKLFEFNGHDNFPPGITEGANGVSDPSSVGDKAKLGATSPHSGTADLQSDPSKGFYENLPFHGMQNPPNKPLSVNASYSRENPVNFMSTQKSLSYENSSYKAVKRYQSFHGFQCSQHMHQLTTYPKFNLNQSHPDLNNWKNRLPSNYQPILNFNPFTLPNPFAVPPRRVVGRRKSVQQKDFNFTRFEVLNSAKANMLSSDAESKQSEKRFNSLEFKKHKSHSPTFYSVRCKRHAKRRPVAYTLPKKISESFNNNVQTIKYDSNKYNTEMLETTASKDEDNSKSVQNVDVSSSSNDDSDNKVSIIKVEIHSPEEKCSDIMDDKAKASFSAVKTDPKFVAPSPEAPKNTLASQIQTERRNLSDDFNNVAVSRETLPLIPEMPLLYNKWSPRSVQENAFYTLTTPHYKHVNIGLPLQCSATVPHQKHTSLLPRPLFAESLSKSKSFTSKSKPKKHFQIPLQKCHSFKFQTAESYFQPIRNIYEDDMKNGYVNNQPRHHKQDQLHQKSKGPLVVMRSNEYHGGINFSESVQSSIQLQYPQPVLGSSLKHPNGVVYADLDMPKSNKRPHDSSLHKTQKSKPKTEYATLSFNDVGKEIDV